MLLAAIVATNVADGGHKELRSKICPFSNLDYGLRPMYFCKGTSIIPMTIWNSVPIFRIRAVTLF